MKDECDKYITTCCMSYPYGIYIYAFPGIDLNLTDYSRSLNFCIFNTSTVLLKSFLKFLPLNFPRTLINFELDQCMIDH